MASMRRWVAVFGSLVLVVLFGGSAAGDEDAPVGPGRASEQVDETQKPEIEHLGGERYRVGPIEVDKAAGRFSVPATVLRDSPPLEFLAVTKGGYKDYESLLQLSATAFEFNLACILSGFEPDNGEAPRFHFDPEPAKGDPVELWLTWTQDGAAKRVEAARLFRFDGGASPVNDWVYTGSMFTADGRYLAAVDGTAVGFVHDPASIIEHRVGIGVGNFGSVDVDRTVAPPVGTAVTLMVERRASARPEQSETPSKQGTPADR